MDPNALKDEFKDLIAEAKKRTANESGASDFFKMLHSLHDKAQGAEDEDCPEGTDCDDLLSECCNSVMTTVFGSTPLLVKCLNCEKTYVLRSLLNNNKLTQV